MIQKRKVKNLISVEKNHNSLLTTLLLLLGGVLCVGAIGLLATSMLVKASTITYEGVDNKAEVVFDMSFVPENKLSGDVVDNMYLKGRTFYISGGSLVLTGKHNEIVTGKNINILGGKSMNIKSKNISIIGGANVRVHTGNDNITVLGGKDNKIYQSNSNSVPNVVLGGQNLEMKKNIGGVMIGGKYNEIGGDGGYDVKYGYILGGLRNRIEDDSNMVILGGDKIDSLLHASNIFAFGDGSENNSDLHKYILGGETGSNAFYLIVENGVGLGMDALTGGISSSGAVSLGDISLFSQRCDVESKGVMGIFGGCLIGCTEYGVNNGQKWEMMDHSETCKKKCETNEGFCIVTDGFVTAGSSSDYPSYCTGDADVSKALQCNYNLIDEYHNVVYEKKLIDFNDNCSDNKRNKCTFKCQKRYPNVTPDGKECTDKNVRSCGTMSIQERLGRCWRYDTYIEGESDFTTWTYGEGKTCGELLPCEWSCSEGFVRSGNRCTKTIVIVPFDPTNPIIPFDPIRDPVPIFP